MSVKVPYGKVIVEVMGGIVIDVHAPDDVKVVVVDHDILEEAERDQIEDAMEDTPELPWGTDGYNYLDPARWHDCEVSD